MFTPSSCWRMRSAPSKLPCSSLNLICSCNELRIDTSSLIRSCRSASSREARTFSARARPASDSRVRPASANLFWTSASVVVIRILLMRSSSSLLMRARASACFLSAAAESVSTWVRPVPSSGSPPPILRFDHAIRSPAVMPGLKTVGFAATDCACTRSFARVCGLASKTLIASPAPRKCARYRLVGSTCTPARASCCWFSAVSRSSIFLDISSLVRSASFAAWS
ncbi:hypothetical protein D3C71_1242450 [compost metagenome]